MSTTNFPKGSRREWLAKHDARYRAWWGILGPPEPIPEGSAFISPKSTDIPPCVHLGKRIEFRPGCDGRNCRHECDLGLPAVPNGYCRTCDRYEADSASPETVEVKAPRSPLAAEAPTVPATVSNPPPGPEPTPTHDRPSNSPVASGNGRPETYGMPYLPPPRPGFVKWSYGVTTVPSRRDELLPRTLASLRLAGFDRPRLFVDGGGGAEVGGGKGKESHGSRSWEDEFGLDVTYRGGEPARVAANWYLALAELYARAPSATHFAVFQDDFVTCKNLRQYLERCPPPDGSPAHGQPKGYWNLYTFPLNQEACPRDDRNQEFVGWYEARGIVTRSPVYDPNGKEYQGGKGAVALVFTRETVIELLGSPVLVGRFRDVSRGHKNIDGGIVNALNRVGYRELVHNPSLVQHTGDVSSRGGRPQKKAVSFPGEGYDLMDLIRRPSTAGST